MVELRPYQKKAVNNAVRLLNDDKNPIIVHATGTGKTTSMAELVKRELDNDGTVLVLAHRVELLNQIVTSGTGGGQG